MEFLQRKAVNKSLEDSRIPLIDNLEDPEDISTGCLSSVSTPSQYRTPSQSFGMPAGQFVSSPNFVVSPNFGMPPGFGMPVPPAGFQGFGIPPQLNNYYGTPSPQGLPPACDYFPWNDYSVSSSSSANLFFLCFINWNISVCVGCRINNLVFCCSQ